MAQLSTPEGQKAVALQELEEIRSSWDWILAVAIKQEQELVCMSIKKEDNE